MNPICFYSDKSLDSVCAAAIVRHFVPECELKPFDEFDYCLFPVMGVDPAVDASDEIMALSENLIKRTVYMVGCSLPSEEMKRLAEVSELIVLNNAYSFIKMAEKKFGLAKSEWPWRGQATRNLGTCELCWDWFVSSDSPIPQVIRLIGAYASGRKDEPDAEAFWYGLKTMEGIESPNFFMWDNLCWNANSKDVEWGHIKDTIMLGSAVVSYREIQNRRIAEAGAFETWFTFPYYWVRIADDARLWLAHARCICLNTPIFEESMFDSVYDPKKHDLKVAVFTDGTKWHVKLFGEKADEVSKRFGGSGGEFTCDRLPWEM